jgi:hypothetical protein
MNVVYKILPVVLLFLLLPSVAGAQFATLTPFTGTSSGTLLDAIRNIVNGLLVLASVVAAIVLIFSFATSLAGKDSEDVALRLRSTIIFTLVGLIIIALSAVLVNFFILAVNP